MSETNQDIPTARENDEDAVPATENGDNGAPAPEKEADAIKNDGKLLLTVLKYNKIEGKAMSGGKLAPSPSQLAASALSIIRAYLLKEGYLSKDDGNKPFCTKDGIEVTDEITLDHYMEESPNTSTSTSGQSGNASEAGGSHDETANKNAKPVKHNIYILTKKRSAGLDSTADAFIKKGVDLTNTGTVDFLAASTGNPLTSSFKSSSWEAEASGNIVHPVDMTEKEWGIVMRTNKLLCGQYLRTGPVDKVVKVQGHPDIKRPSMDVVDVKRSYYSAFALKPRNLPEYDITFKITDKASEEMHKLGIPHPGHSFRIPRFQIKDSSQVRVFETKGSLETTMAESSFTSQSLDAAVGGSGFGVSVAVKGGASWGNDDKSASSKFNDSSYMHVVYEFPRVELILNEENLELSDECKEDVENLRNRRTLKELAHFEERYGNFFARSIHLGGKLISIEESDSVAGSSVEEKKKMLKAAASASMSGYGFQAEVNYSQTENSGTKTTSTEKKMTHSMSWSADGGDTTLCNNPPKWCSTVSNFYNWRVMKQDDVVNIYEFMGKLPGYEDIPKLIYNITHLNPEPTSLVQFSLHLEAGSENGPRVLTFGEDTEQEIAPLDMDPLNHGPNQKSGTQDNVHSLRQHRKELISEIKFSKAKSGEYSTVFGIPISNDQSNISIEGADSVGISHPRFKYGVKYPIHYLVNATNGEEEEVLLHSLQIGGDGSSKPFLYGKHDTASNIMVEFEPIHKTTKKKTTPIAQNDKVRLRFSYLPTDTAVHRVSNFRMKDVDDMIMPKSSDLKRLAAQLPGRPEPPVEPEFSDSTLKSLEEGRNFYAMLLKKGHSSMMQAKLDQFDARIKAHKESRAYKEARVVYDLNLRHYKSAKLIYDQRVKEYDLRVQEELKKTGQQTQRLKEEWEQHQRDKNKLVVFDEFTFRVEYCDAKNGKNLGTAIEAAKKALAAEKAAKDAEAAEQAAGEATEEAKRKAEAAAAKAHDEEVERRKKLLFPGFFIIQGYEQWLAQKKKLERAACLLDDGKAATLREDIKTKDKNMTMCAEWDLDEDILTASSKLGVNPFWVPAMALVKVPGST
ncbi:hypothetical protein NUU61_000761 [Penicillium alfredii]|uniref:MACPF-like domain-containing protein n=1 Tax=Penicillium alfredii TaxID=1506179 RepID=A0A9W9GAJ0_9EURO|nr:uncharacterized protein NUU61_000761 [Penicillium alfredii]KAJ5115002.1 hypothetical protein NUU61_000761 [Penicillium alfredii]